VKIGLMPGLPNNQRDPDRTRNFVQEPSQPNGEGGVAAAGTDPLSAGPVSGGVTLSSFALMRLAGLQTFFGFYGTFDETGLVELDPEKREAEKLRAKAAEKTVDESLDGAGAAHEEQ
jgi:hypothetical protein